MPREVAAEVVFLAETNTLVLGIPFSEALKTVEKEDDAPVKTDAFDDPRVSRDTLLTQYTHTNTPIKPHYPSAAKSGSQVSGFLAHLLMLLRSKWVWLPVLLFVGYRLTKDWLMRLL